MLAIVHNVGKHSSIIKQNQHSEKIEQKPWNVRTFTKNKQQTWIQAK